MDASAETSLRAALRQWDQHHVLAQLDASPPSPPLLQQLLHFESWYAGGVDSYLRTATRLFREQRQQQQQKEAHGGADATATTEATTEPTDAEGSDPFAAWTPTVPQDTYGLLDLKTPKFRELEALGLAHAADSAFVVVAGGLGERLGYSGIKLALPVETATRTSYLETYIQHIQALQRQLSEAATIPLAIMTSDATHEPTQRFLDAHDYFGLPRAQLTLLKQDTVPCLDAAASGALQLVLDAAQQTLVMKPHGHGDVHTLLHASGLARAWLRDQRKKYVHFIQDTNALILQSTLPLLGASVANRWQWAFTVVPRKAKDASGAIVQFTDPQSGGDASAAPALFNVEYHELDQFLRSQAGDAFRDGDTNDPRTGFSPFPGNINHFVVALDAYVRVLDQSRGKTPEIFNPKVRADAPGLFKSPARLECMMQDFPKLLVASLLESATTTEGGAPVGFLSFPASLVYSPCKNDTASAAAKVAADIPPQCLCSAEHEYFALQRAKLEHIGVRVKDDASGVEGSRAEWLGIPVAPNARGPHVALAPSFAVGVDALAQRFPSPSEVSITNRSTLIVQGDGASGVSFHSLVLDGALQITACEGATVEVRGLEVSNAGFEYAPVGSDADVDPVDKMRGYIIKALEVMELTFHLPGRYIVENSGQVTKA